MSQDRQKKLLVLGARQMQLPAIATAKEMGLSVAIAGSCDRDC